MFDLLIPLLLLAVAVIGLRRQQDVYGLLAEGGADGLRLLARITPSLVVLLTAVSMLRASGAVDLITSVCAPVFRWFGLPPETAPLILLRPLSGSAALAVGGELMASFGPDSPVGRTAAVMLGSTETTVYVLTVYFGAAGVRRSRHALPAALCADLAGFLAAAWCVRLLG